MGWYGPFLFLSLAVLISVSAAIAIYVQEAKKRIRAAVKKDGGQLPVLKLERIGVRPTYHVKYRKANGVWIEKLCTIGKKGALEWEDAPDAPAPQGQEEAGGDGEGNGDADGGDNG